MSSKFIQPLIKGTEVFPDVYKQAPSMRVAGPGTRTAEGRERFNETVDKINQFVVAMNQNYALSQLKTYEVKRDMGNGISVTYSNQYDKEYIYVWVDAVGAVREREHDPFVFIGVRLLNADDVSATLNLFVWEVGNDEILSPSRAALGEGAVPLAYKSVMVNGKEYSYTSGGMWAAEQVTTPIDVTNNQRDGVVWDQGAVLDYEDRDKIREMSGDTIPVAGYVGVYQIKVNLTADDCEDYPPAECELYVVAGRNASQFQEVYNFTIQRGTNYLYLTYPFGAGSDSAPYQVSFAKQQPPPDFGPNPHAFNWWQDGVEVFSVPKAITEFDQTQPKAQWSEAFESSITFVANLIPDTGFEPGDAPDEPERCPVSKPEWVQVHQSSTDTRYMAKHLLYVAPWGPTDNWTSSAIPFATRFIIYKTGGNLQYTYDYYPPTQYSEGGRQIAQASFESTRIFEDDIQEILYDSGVLFPQLPGNDLNLLTNSPAEVSVPYGDGLVYEGYFSNIPFNGFTVTNFQTSQFTLSIQDSDGVGSVDFKDRPGDVPLEEQRDAYYAALADYCAATGKGAIVFVSNTDRLGNVTSFSYQRISPTDIANPV